MKFKSLVIALSGVAVILAGCSDPKKPSEANFRKALDEKLAKINRSCFARVSNDPQKLFWVGIAGLSMGCSQKECGPLEAAGLVTKAEGNYPGFFGNGQAYKLAEAGEQYLVVTPKGDSHFCFAKAKTDKIERWSEPADMFGATVSEVSYTVKFDGIPAWAQSADVQGAIPEIKSAIDSQGKPEKSAARLFNDGWRFEW